MIKVETSRFGEIEVDEAKVITMEEGIIGFEQAHQFILLEQDKKAPFRWYQCVDDGNLAFVVINPQLVKQDYEPFLDDYSVDELEITGADDVALMAIVTIRSNPIAVTANLRAPLVINTKNSRAKQVILDDPLYPIRYDILSM